jgi:uncharacterized protein (DUF433 family)
MDLPPAWAGYILKTVQEVFMSTTPLITRSEDVLWGTPVFAETRVPVQTLFDYLEGGHALEEFLDDFPTVSRERVLALLELAKDTVLEHAHAA